MRVFAAAVAMCLAGLAISAQAPAPSDLDRALRDVAALAGEPSIVSAAGITRADTPLPTIENPDSFVPSPTLRLVIVGGLDGDVESSRAAIDAVRWFKTKAPRDIRARWAVSAVPLADPQGHAHEQPWLFPPAKGFFDDPDQPESRYLWRWITFQAPDLVVVVGDDANATSRSLVTALGADHAAGLGSVPALVVKASEAATRIPRQLADRSSRSPLHDAIVVRVAHSALDVARVLARRYPESPTVSYIPSVAWVNTLRLAAATGDELLRAKVKRQIAPWLSGEKKLFGDQIQLTSVAGTMIYAELARDGDAAALALAEEGARRAAERQPSGIAAYSRGWTDDMFMASSVLARTASLPQHAGDLDAAAKLVIDYAGRLQRADGLFVHASDAPAAWGRGNGFALMGLTEVLTALPEKHELRMRVLDIYRRHVAALKAAQAPDGMWREVIDEPGSYREETATAMILTAVSRGIRLRWLDDAYRPVATRAWRALAAHVADDGALVDVCTSTGGGPTKRYYLDRAAISGPDDRGGAMALLAAMETYELNSRR